jgi:Ca-activated chloride channel family protein
MFRMEPVSGRHRRTFILGKAGMVAVGLAVLLLLTGSWYGYRQLTGEACTGRLTLTVAAATEIAPAVRQAADQWTKNGADVDGTCVAVAVSGVSPATMTAAIAREHKVALTGLGPAPTSVGVPDVWVPDSSTWLVRLRSDATGFVPTDGRPIAQSPIVLAVPTPIAQGMGWPGKKVAWKDLLGQMTAAGNGLKAGIVDPSKDATGLTGLLALGGAAGSDAAGAKAKVGALRALATESSSIRDDLLQKFPHSPADIGSALGAAPLSEADVIAYNKQQPPVDLAALYVQPSPPPLDYPYAIMPEIGLQKAAAANALHGVLAQAAFRDALGAAGLRAPDGTTGAGFATPTGAPAATGPITPPDAATAAKVPSAINQVIGSWAAITQPGRVLAVFDVSGSMLEKVPTAGGLNRAQVTQGAAAQGLALFDDRWAVGNWIFSTDLVGTRPWKELVPITPLSSGRERLQQAIGQIVPKKNGDTGLYDTALAAYKEVRDSWEGGRVNSVILFTDGKNDNPDGITQAQLVSQLRKLRDPRRPVRMIIIGIGTGVDRNELQTIVGATSSGGVYIAPDPAKISDIFLEAIATRSGA